MPLSFLRARLLQPPTSKTIGAIMVTDIARRPLSVVLMTNTPKVAFDGRKFLQACGHRMERASSESKMLNLVATSNVDVLLLDTAHSTFNALDICRHFKSKSDESPIIVLMVKDFEKQDEHQEAGTDFEIIKPLNQMGVQEVLHLCETERREREIRVLQKAVNTVMPSDALPNRPRSRL